MARLQFEQKSGVPMEEPHRPFQKPAVLVNSSWWLCLAVPLTGSALVPFSTTGGEKQFSAANLFHQALRWATQSFVWGASSQSR